MPYNWTPAAERQMLLLAIAKANLKPTSETWVAVASLLGQGLTPSAVSQKFYKLRSECGHVDGESRTPSAQNTPKKRKRDTRPQPAISQAAYDESDDVQAIGYVPTRLIADRPFNKMYRDGQVAEQGPVKKQKVEPIKREQSDAPWHESDTDYVPSEEKGVDATATEWV